jgi:hypothetical protein
MARFDFRINGERLIGYGTEPDFMITFPLALEVTMILPENLLQVRGKIWHLAMTRRVEFFLAFAVQAKRNSFFCAFWDNAIFNKQLWE